MAFCLFFQTQSAGQHQYPADQEKGSSNRRNKYKKFEVRQRQAIKAATEQHRTQRQTSTTPVKPHIALALHRHTECEYRQRMYTLVGQTGLDPGHFCLTQRIIQYMGTKSAKSNIDKAADSGENQH